MKRDIKHIERLGEIGLFNFEPYLMNRIMGRYNSSIRDELLALGLTTPQLRTLAVLSVVEAPLISQLAVYSVVDQSTLSRALDRLEKEKLVTKKPDEEDSRAIRVSITPAGRKMFDRLWPILAEEREHLFEKIPDQERRQFLATLQKILTNVRKHPF